jgi:hypothetical protein
MLASAGHIMSSSLLVILTHFDEVQIMPRFNLVLSEEMDRQIDQLVTEPETKSTVVRKALAMYLAAARANRDGLLVGFFDPKTREVKQEVVGL